LFLERLGNSWFVDDTKSVSALLTQELFIKAAKRNGALLKYVDEESRIPELCLAVVATNGAAFEFIPWEQINLSIPEKEALCDTALKTYPFALEFFPADFKTPERCHAAIEKDGRVIRFVPAAFLTQELCIKAVSSHADAIEYIPEQFRTSGLWAATLAKNGYWLKEAPWVQLKLAAPETEELCRLAVSSYGKALEHVPWGLLNLSVSATKELFFSAIKQDGMALKYVDLSKLSPEEYTEICKIAFYGENTQ
jgi:uncharacterized membrane protein YecN with MAPEG domain